MCHDDSFIDEQCLKAETIGSNTFVWLRKCKGSKVCVQLPYYGGITGSCIIKVRSHYDGESCANGNKCTSGNCDGSKCIGKDKGIRCEPRLGQCKKGLLCRKKTKDDNYHQCLEPINAGEPCGGLIESHYYKYPGDNVCRLGYACTNPTNSNNGKCVKIGSIKENDNDNNNNINNPLVCETGLYSSSQCTSSASDNGWGRTSRGLPFTNYANATRHFNDWLDASTYDDDTEDEDAIYEAYRYTRNKKKINELWFRYVASNVVEDADECAYDYYWKNNSGNYIQFSFLIIALTLLF